MFKRRRDEPAAGEQHATPEPAVATAPAALFPAPRADTFPSEPGPSAPPFRLATKDTPMARPPFNTPPPAPHQPTPGPGAAPRPASPMMPPPNQSAPGGPAPPQSGQPPTLPGQQPGQPRPQPQERRTLVVGRGISLKGVIQDAERLVVEGTVEAQLLHASELAVAPGGIFKGEVEVESAEIAGTIDGSVTARASLVVRGTGRVVGTARCRRLQVEDGGQISGQIEMITEGPAPRGA